MKLREMNKTRDILKVLQYNIISLLYLDIPVSFVEIFTLPNEDFAVLTAAGDGAGSEAGVRRPGYVSYPIVVPLQLSFHLPRILLVAENV